MITVLLLAAGKGERTALSDNKTKYLINEKPVFYHAYKTFIDLGLNVIVITRKEDEQDVLNWVNSKVIIGSATRSDSVYNGLKEVRTKYVCIHDGARPFIDKNVVKNALEKTKDFDALMVCKKVTSTIYNKDLLTIDRDQLIEAETPQIFLTEKLQNAYKNKNDKEFTDDIGLYKTFYPNDLIGLVFHETNNEKITTKQAVEQYFMPVYKIGHSYDIHQLQENKKLILGGIPIDYTYGLLGHSDADVLLHAIGESILGALGLGDLGTHFPDTDMKFKDLDSKEIILYCKRKCRDLGYEIQNIDASIYAEKPKLAAYIQSIKNSVAALLEIDPSLVNIKAGTNEKLDAVGQEKAIASEAVCLLKGYKK